MSVFLRQRWRQQPQGAVSFDTSSALAQAIGLDTAWSGTNPRMRFSVRGGLQQNTINNFDGLSVRSGRYAPNSSIGAVLTAENSPDIDLGAMPSMTELSLIAVLSQGATINKQAIATRTSSSSVGFDLASGANAVLGRASLRIQTSAGLAEVVLGPTFNDSFTHTHYGTWKQGNLPRYYVDKLENVATGGTLNGTITHAQNLKIGNRATNRWTGFVSLLLVGTKQNINAGLELLENPWQIFKPQQAVFYSLPSGNLFSALDETVSDRNDYILSSSAGQVYQTTLSPVTQPGAGTNIDFNFDAASPEDSGSIKFDLLSGSTVVKSQSVSLVRNWAGRIRSPRLRRQPQGAVQIDWSHPIARGLIGAWTGSSPNLNLVTGAAIPNTRPNVKPGRNGLEFEALIGANSIQLLSAGQAPTGQACVTLLYRKRDTTNRTSQAFEGAASPGRFQAHLPWSDGVVYFDYGGDTGASRVSVGGLTFGNDVWSFNNSPTGLQIWQNGILRASNNSASPTRTSSPLSMFGSAADAANTAVFLVHNRSLTGSEIASLAQNPWQIFRPPSRAVCFPSPAQTSFAITPSDYSVISSWPWTPTLKVTSL